jgi:hypothetical protein
MAIKIKASEKDNKKICPLINSLIMQSHEHYSNVFPTLK